MQPNPAPWPICFGLETELGITVMEDPEADVVEESIALVRSAAQHGVSTSGITPPRTPTATPAASASAS